MGSTQMQIQNSVYIRLKMFRNENNLKSFSEAIWVLMKQYNRYYRAGENTDIPPMDHNNMPEVTIEPVTVS